MTNRLEEFFKQETAVEEGERMMGEAIETVAKVALMLKKMSKPPLINPEEKCPMPAGCLHIALGTLLASLFLRSKINHQEMAYCVMVLGVIPPEKTIKAIWG